MKSASLTTRWQLTQLRIAFKSNSIETGGQIKNGDTKNSKRMMEAEGREIESDHVNRDWSFEQKEFARRVNC